MPKRRAEDTPGMVMTDHRIQRRLPPGDLLAEFREPPPEEYRGPVVPYYPSPFPNTGENALYRAIAQVGLGNNLEAGLPALERELQRQKPRNPEFYLILGDALNSAAMYPKAADAYEQAVRLNPSSSRALRGMAVALEKSGNSAQAAEILKRAVELAPSDPEFWFQLGMLDSAAGRIRDAIAKVEKAIALDPSRPEKSRRLAEILLKSGQSDRALTAVQDALRTDPYDEDAWDLSGRILTEKSAFAEAWFDFERAIRLRPTSATYLYDYALALARGDRSEEAQQRAQTAIQVDPKLAEAHELLGGIFTRKRQLPEAAEEYRRAIALRPDLSRLHLRLGNVLAAQGDIPAARDHLRQASSGTDRAVAQEAARALEQLAGRQ
jgi:tetratricopeptide (TPR) repeat protein